MPRKVTDQELNELRLRPYRPCPTAVRFHASGSFFRGIRGPFGSGKSTACVMEILSRALEQKPHGRVRRSRWAVLRNSYNELLTTTIKTWADWVPVTVAPIRETVPIQAHLQAALSDGTEIDLLLYFLSFDHPDDIRKLKSLEVTGAWLNEASELPEECLTAVSPRVGRYPSLDEGGASWHGIIADTNSPDDSNWWYRLAEIDKPRGYEFFDQPPALVEVPSTDSTDPLASLGAGRYLPNVGKHDLPAAENIDNLPGGFEYYLNLVPGKSRDWVRVYLLNQYGATRGGKVVYPEYNDILHYTSKPLLPVPNLPLFVGWDFGLSVSCVLAQFTPRGQLRVLREIIGDDIGIQRFVRDYFKPCLAQHYPNYNLVMTGDPAGSQRSQTTEQTCFGILAEEGFVCNAAASNDFAARREAVSWFLTRLSRDGSAFLISPDCRMLRKGFLRGYQYRQMKLAGDRYTDRPDKNEYSHIHDALQYLCMYLRNMGYAFEEQRVKLPPAYGQRELEVKPSPEAAW